MQRTLGCTTNNTPAGGFKIPQATEGVKRLAYAGKEGLLAPGQYRETGLPERGQAVVKGQKKATNLYRLVAQINAF